MSARQERATGAERRQEREKLDETNRDSLLEHLEQQDKRLRQTALEKQAAMQKRLADAFDPRPARRKMYDDRTLELAAQVPGPGEYTPRLRSKDSSGKTFGAAPFVSMSGTSSVTYDRDAGSPDAWKVKTAAAQPGPASYSPSQPRGACGSTFGLPPDLRGGKVVPAAHDMSKMVAHLRELPAPDAYSPRNPMEKNKGFRIKPSKALSSLEQVMLDAAKVPGPGAYSLEGALPAGRSSSLGGGGQIKTDLECVMERAKYLPGPGAYPHASQLRARGSPRFSKAGSLSLIAQIQVEAKTKPGPGTYHPTPTFKEELEAKKWLKSVVKGDIAVASPR